MLPDDAVSALLIRTAGGVDLQDMAVRLTRLDRDLEVLAAPAYVQTLRQSLRRVRRLVELCGFTMLLAVYLSIAALRRSRQSRAIGIQSGPQAV
jgi:hypothetical protein